jgi:hypothetical protein
VPTSDKQLAANRANAAKSSSENARTHGFSASSFVVVRLEDLNEIANLRTDLIAVYRPVNSQELFALEQMALAQHQMRRVARLGSGIFTVCLDMATNCNGSPITPMGPNLVGEGETEVTQAQNRNFSRSQARRIVSAILHFWRMASVANDATVREERSMSP